MTEISCNCFVREEMLASADVVWRPNVDFSMLSHSFQQNRKCTANLRSRGRRRPVAHLFLSWIGKSSSQRIPVVASPRDECCHSNTLESNLFLSVCENARVRRTSMFSETFPIEDQIVEEPWLLQPSLVSPLVADLDVSNDIENEINTQKSTFLNKSRVEVDLIDRSEFDMNSSEPFDDPLVPTYYPVEEPWLFESSICRNPVEVTQLEINGNDQSIEEDILHEEEEHNLMMEDIDTVSTVILINSSICTMQRIAVLEDTNLVELLLEPVKNTVHCDSVYLGVVTKLAPHMGGAFVNIGSARPSFMDIRPNREPFILSPFQDYTKPKELSESIFDKGGVFSGNGSFSYGVEEPDEVEDDQSEEDESNDDEFGGLDNRFRVGGLEVIKENINGSVVGHKSEINAERLDEQLDGDVDQLQIKNVAEDVNKWAQVRKGSKLIVQVVKEGLGTKGPTLTAYPKLKSRFWILMTRCKTIGISKKISGVERTRLRVIAKTLQPSGFGVTLRTVASGHSLEELQKDLESLLSTWKSITEHAKSAALAADEGVDEAVPAMLHRAMGQTLCVVQDYFNERVKKLIVDSPRTYHEVTNYIQEIAPNLCERIELYSKKTPLFDEFNIEGEINNILSKRVALDNGGYLVIEQTEALVSVDVNGGHCMLGQGTSQEKAILEVNLAAAKQIARELRLRDIGGIIVVDFIDMSDDSNKRLVYEEVKRAVERDRSMVKVSELSRHGLMEITRKRVRPSVTFMISEPCTCCHATGRVEALETSFSKIEHEICRFLSTVDQKADVENPKSWPQFILRVDQHMSNYLTSGKRTRLAVLSSSLKVWILLKVARGLSRGTFELKPLMASDDENTKKNQHRAVISSVLRPSPSSGPGPGPTEVVAVRRYKTSPPARNKVSPLLFPIKKWITGGSDK